jgi:hypothetical protein
MIEECCGKAGVVRLVISVVVTGGNFPHISF